MAAARVIADVKAAVSADLMRDRCEVAMLESFRMRAYLETKAAAVHEEEEFLARQKEFKFINPFYSSI